MNKLYFYWIKLFQLPIKAYRYLISPYFGNCCRFHPSCSVYALQAFEQHGVVNGLWLTALRLLRCAPWGGSGIDKVPAQPPLSLARLSVFFKLSSHSEKL